MKSFRKLSLRERAVLSKHLKPEQDVFRTEVTFSDGKTWPTTKSIAELRSAGLRVVDNGNNEHIPANNIIGARSVAAEDVDPFTGVALMGVFATVVQTKNGDIYSARPVNHVLEDAELAMTGRW